MTEHRTPAQKVLGIVHTAIAVSDLAHQIEFWQQVLGFRLEGTAEIGGPLPEDETGVPGIRSKIAMLTREGHTIELYQPTAPEGRETYRPQSGGHRFVASGTQGHRSGRTGPGQRGVGLAGAR